MPRDAITQAGYPDAVVRALFDAMTRVAHERAPAWLVGLSGLQGSGKSTLAAQLVELARARGVAALAMSIDDFYHGRDARRRLARTVHPLLATRGVPGTHDVGLLRHTLANLRIANPDRPACVPRFDKGRDTRLPPSRWRRIAQAPALVVLEGWCIGVPAQTPAQLRKPVNELERREDADARWRNWINSRLEQEYAPLWHEFDRLVMLQAPGFEVVTQWRGQQEQALRRRGAPHALSAPALRRFLMHYERLSRQALKTLPARADLRVVLDSQRRVERVVVRLPT